MADEPLIQGMDFGSQQAQAQQPPPPQLIQINDDVGPITSLVTFDMRNGDLADARSLLIKPTIPQAWHWRPIGNVAPQTALHHTAAYIRSAKANLDANPPQGLSQAQIRKAAIVVGVTRAVSTELYRLTENDLIPGESAPPLLTAEIEDDQLTGYTSAPGLPANVAQSLNTELVLTDVEKAAVAAIHMSAIGVIPVQGYSLTMTGHHYLSDPATQSRRAFAAIEKQFWSSTQVSDWWTQDVDLLRDVLWHKSTHPVNMTIKTTLAHMDSIPRMLTDAGAGSAAARLPVQESEVRAANSYKTLLLTVRPMYEELGGITDYSALEQALYAVSLFPYGGPEATLQMPPSVPPTVNSRDKAIAHLKNLLEGNTDTVAHAYGFYCAMTEQAQMVSQSARTNTLKTSFSLQKLENQSLASYTAGQQFYGDYQAIKLARRQAGNVKAVNLGIFSSFGSQTQVGQTSGA